MKKIITIIVIIGVVTWGAWYFMKSIPEGVKPAELLPADTLFMVELLNLEKSIKDFKKGGMSQQLKKIDFFQVMQKMKVPEKTIEKYKKAKSAALSTLDNRVFKELFGQKAVFALLPIKFKQFSLDEINKVLGSVVVICHPKHRLELVEFVSQIYTQNLECEIETYGKYKIKHFNLKYGIPIYYVWAKGLLITTFDQQRIKNLIDIMEKQNSSLIKNETYQHLRRKLDSSRIRSFAYINIEKTYENIVNISQSVIGEKEKFAAFERSLAGLKGLKSFGYASYHDGSNLFQQKMLIMVDKEKLDPVYARIYFIKPEENRTLPMIPKNTLFYYWANNLHLKTYLDIYFQNQPEDDETKELQRLLLEKEIDVSEDEMVHAFGNQFGFILRDINTGGPFPIPKLTLFVEAKNKDIAVQLIERATRKLKLGLAKEKFKDTEINYLMLPFGSDFQPAYAFLNNFCLISISRQLIKDMISTYYGEENITSDKDFLSVNRGLIDRNNSIMFIKFDHLIEKIKEVISWGKNIMAFKDPSKAEEGAIFINGVVNPVLDSLKMYRTIGSRTFTIENEIETDIYCKIES